MELISAVGEVQFTCRVHLEFQLKKILEASGMVFRFQSLQVTFFCFSQSDFIKKKIFHVKKKKLVVKLIDNPCLDFF